MVIVDYRSEWAARFARERHRIAAALGPAAMRIDHIGSTAVPGLAAKPIVDIDVSVADVEQETIYLPALERTVPAAGARGRPPHAAHARPRRPCPRLHR